MTTSGADDYHNSYLYHEMKALEKEQKAIDEKAIILEEKLRKVMSEGWVKLLIKFIFF
jgi:hypothetical protein